MTSRDLGQIWNTKSIFVRAGEKVMINSQGKGLSLVWEKTVNKDFVAKAEAWLAPTSSLLLLWI